MYSYLIHPRQTYQKRLEPTLALSLRRSSFYCAFLDVLSPQHLYAFAVGTLPLACYDVMPEAQGRYVCSRIPQDQWGGRRQGRKARLRSRLGRGGYKRVVATRKATCTSKDAVVVGCISENLAAYSQKRVSGIVGTLHAITIGSRTVKDFTQDSCSSSPHPHNSCV